MKFKDKPDRDKRWVTVVVSANRAPVSPITKDLSWHKTLMAYGIPHEVAVRYIDLRGEANRATEADPSHVAVFEYEGIKIHYQQHRIS
ncbi:hypothetical protein NMD10_27610 (plasmid) [Citrobacter portucalensis]|uniref:hypothetical protein n=1 Tax=Citrobacter portucalensis TaxID=1639133 RepID=UPI00351DA8B4